jgi:hypothetical protein
MMIAATFAERIRERNTQPNREQSAHGRLPGTSPEAQHWY